MSSQSKQDKPRRPARTKTGVVISTGGAKTIRVRIDNLVKHPQYGKYIRRRTKLAVADPDGKANLGDTVQIAPCRPVSKTKSWRLVQVVRAAALIAER